MVTFFLQIIKPYKWWYLLMLQASVVSGCYPVIYNYAVKLLIDLFTQNQILTWDMAFYPIMMFVIAQAVCDIPWRIHTFAQLKAIPKTGRDITLKINEHIYNHSYNFFQNNFSGSIISKTKGINDGFFKLWGDIEHKLSHPFYKMIFSGIALATANIKIFSLLLLFFVLYTPIGYFFFAIKAKNAEQKTINNWHMIVGKIADNITNIFTIFAFASKKRELKKLETYYEDVHIKLEQEYFRWDLIGSWVSTVCYWVFIVSIFIFLIKLRNAGEISIGDIAFIISLTWIFLQTSWDTLMNYKDAIRHYADFKSSFSILQIPQGVIDKPNATELKISKGEIIFNNLSFGYDDNNLVFQNLNLQIKAGEKIGIVGHSGGGKSTLISLLLKHFKATSGDILIDNQSIYDTFSDSLRSQMSLIPQDVMLFHRTIAENVGYANDSATQIEIENVAKIANIHDFIMTLPEKYNTLVGERGVKLSGGQRQRIAIARAILKNAPILILDEATSALDSQTEQEIQKSINTMLEQNKATVIAVAHRLSTIKHMDRIIVLDSGKIVEDGPFAELILKENGQFKQMWDSQVNGMLG